MIRKYLYLILIFTFTSISLTVYGEEQFESGRSGSENVTVPNEFLLIRTYPSVFKIFSDLEYNYSYPTNFTLKKNTDGISILASEYQKELESGNLNSLLSKAEYYWNKVASNPDKYIETSNYKTINFGATGSGTGFFISREGVLITNAHVVSVKQKIPKEDLDKLYINIDNSLINVIGYKMPNSQHFKQSYIPNIDKWFDSKCTINNKVIGNYLVLDYLIENNSSSNEISVNKHIVLTKKIYIIVA